MQKPRDSSGQFISTVAWFEQRLEAIDAIVEDLRSKEAYWQCRPMDTHEAALFKTYGRAITSFLRDRRQLRRRLNALFAAKE